MRAQGGQWQVTAGSTFHRVSTTLDYCRILPASQPIEQTTVKYNGKVWKAKWETKGRAPGTGADADHEPWKLVGSAS